MQYLSVKTRIIAWNTAYMVHNKQDFPLSDSEHKQGMIAESQYEHKIGLMQYGDEFAIMYRPNHHYSLHV